MGFDLQGPATVRRLLRLPDEGFGLTHDGLNHVNKATSPSCDEGESHAQKSHA
jgi:hypothetical protein